VRIGEPLADGRVQHTEPMNSQDTSPPRVLAMGWHDLLLAHWRVPVEVLRAHIPPDLTIDTFEGHAWIGLVPFRMSGVRPRMLPALPTFSAFPELNLRTYVSTRGRPGGWCFSVDAASWLAVRAARATFHLPYFDARMTCRSEGDEAIEYTSERTHRNAPPARFVGGYRPVGAVFQSRPGTLEYWLTERYCLYAADPAGRVYRGDVQHRPWSLRKAEARFDVCDMTRLIGWHPAGAPEHLLFSRDLWVTASWPVRIDS